MKKLLISLFLVSSVLAFSERVVKGDKAYADDKGIVYVEGEKTPYTGVIEGYDAQGKLEGKANYKDGKMNGSSKLYYPSGKLQSEATFKDNVQDGVQKDYFEDGKVKLELPYKNGKPEGLGRSYYPNGKEKKKMNFLNGMKNGKEIEKKTVMKKITYKDVNKTKVAWIEDGYLASTLNEAVDERFKNLDGEILNATKLANDIYKDYIYLYENYISSKKLSLKVPLSILCLIFLTSSVISVIFTIHSFTYFTTASPLIPSCIDLLPIGLP